MNSLNASVVGSYMTQSENEELDEGKSTYLKSTLFVYTKIITDMSIPQQRIVLIILTKRTKKSAEIFNNVTKQGEALFEFLTSSLA